MEESLYYHQAELVLRILPVIHRYPVFALKGGTAINFFIRDIRIILLSGELLDTIRRQKVILDKLYPACQWVFSYNGQQIKRFTRSWKTACKAVGLDGMIFHDCRRTAVRNMVNSMIPEKVCMKITGHKTGSVFDRYHIINEDDLKRASLIASERLKNKEEELSQAHFGHSDKNNAVNFWR